jgi:glutamine synthetase
VAPSLGAALENFTASAWNVTCFGQDFVDTYSVMQANELASFAAWVTDWETQRYRDVI